ncbi:hypothetical protein [Gymnodinialimonas ulvae]|uniref:hypothetical protein n=1 Tax=Gymnodinialimonas ulvae TaxID=3126504 RepID=UPI0030A23C1B
MANAGGLIVVSANCDPKVISSTRYLGLQAYPSVLTPTECFTAIDAGAMGLKIFPAIVFGPSGVKALTAVLPNRIPLFAVGGAVPSDFAFGWTPGSIPLG